MQKEINLSISQISEWTFIRICYSRYRFNCKIYTYISVFIRKLKFGFFHNEKANQNYIFFTWVFFIINTIFSLLLEKN